ncbi:MAG: rarA [Chlamydiales bacterium]|jgi:putative ATPase|nr:rarA [Chlamydiales bacterium]
MPIPLAEKLRPKAIDEIVGQEHLFGEKGLLTQFIQRQRPVSILLWGPPGCGKTTIARLYAQAFNAKFITLSAVESGVADVRKVVQEVEKTPLWSRETILFVDEIHHFNKAQQDLFLPHIEKGTIVLVGATTENPSYAINSALLSRLRVLPLYPLNTEDLKKIINRYEKLHTPLRGDEKIKQLIIELAQGDGRYLINLLENIENFSPTESLTPENLTHFLQTRTAHYDRQGDQHYNLISALHKSIRGSDPQATLYWLCRMLEGGEDPLYIARRLIRIASEDIGLADPMALQQVIAARNAYETLGSPEGELALAQAAIYLALSPKSNAVELAYLTAKADAGVTTHLSPPHAILNAPTKLLKELGYGKGYLYDHDQPQAFSGQDYLPEGLERQEYYRPTEYGFEKEMLKRLAYFNRLRESRRS